MASIISDVSSSHVKHQKEGEGEKEKEEKVCSWSEWNG